MLRQGESLTTAQATTSRHFAELLAQMPLQEVPTPCVPDPHSAAATSARMAHCAPHVHRPIHIVMRALTHCPAQLGDAYLAGLSLRRRFRVATPSPPPMPPSYQDGPASSNSTSPSSGLTDAARTGVIVGACVGGALMAALVGALVMLHLKQRARQLTTTHHAPSAGPNTTLVVTDIESSTALW